MSSRSGEASFSDPRADAGLSEEAACSALDDLIGSGKNLIYVVVGLQPTIDGTYDLIPAKSMADQVGVATGELRATTQGLDDASGVGQAVAALDLTLVTVHDNLLTQAAELDAMEFDRARIVAKGANTCLAEARRQVWRACDSVRNVLGP